MKRKQGRPSLPKKQAARVRAALRVLSLKYSTDQKVADALSLIAPSKISRVTVGAVLRGATGPSLVVATAAANAIGVTLDALTEMSMDEIAATWLPAVTS